MFFKFIFYIHFKNESIIKIKIPRSMKTIENKTGFTGSGGLVSDGTDRMSGYLIESHDSSTRRVQSWGAQQLGPKAPPTVHHLFTNTARPVSHASVSPLLTVFSMSWPVTFHCCVKHILKHIIKQTCLINELTKHMLKNSFVVFKAVSLDTVLVSVVL